MALKICPQEQELEMVFVRPNRMLLLKSFNILIYYFSKFICTVEYGKVLGVLIKLPLKVDES